MSAPEEPTINIGVFNGGGAFGDPNRYEEYCDSLKKLGSDITVVPEALGEYPKNKNKGPQDVEDYDLFLDRIGDEGEGYKSQYWDVPYEDAEPHPSGEQFLRVIAKPDVEVQSAEIIRLGTRNGLDLVFNIGSEAVRGILFHADDRTQELRRGMANAVKEAVQSNPEQPTLTASDENDGPRTNRTKVMRHIFGLVKHVPQQRIKSLASRGYEMTESDSEQFYLDAGLHDVDLAHQPTSFFITPKLPIMQLDRIRINDHLESKKFRRRVIPGSDQHVSIDADIGLLLSPNIKML